MKLFQKLYFKKGYFDSNGILKSLFFYKILGYIIKEKKLNLGLYLSIYENYLDRNKSNNITLLLLSNYFDKKIIEKNISKRLIIWYYRLLFISTISIFLFRWCHEDAKKKIPKQLLSYLDGSAGISKDKLSIIRKDMTKLGWISKKITNEHNKNFSILRSSIPNSLLYNFKIVVFGELFRIFMMILLRKKIKIDLLSKLVNIINFSITTQFPIFLISLYNIFSKNKPNKNLLKYWCLLSPISIFLYNKKQTKLAAFMSSCTLINKYLVDYNINTPNSLFINHILRNNILY